MRLILPWKRAEVTKVWTWPHRSWIYYFGTWPELGATTRHVKFLTYLGHFVLIWATLTAISSVIHVTIKMVEGALVENLFAVYQVAPISLAAFKIHQLNKHRRPYKQAMDLIDELTKGLKEPEEIAMFRFRMIRTWVMFTVSMTTTVLATAHWFLRPLLIAFIQGKKTRIFETWPTYLDTWTQFTISFLIHIISLLPGAYGFCIYDVFYLSLADCILCHIMIYRKKLENLHIRKHNDEETLKIKEYVVLHTKILKVCELMKSSSDAVIFFHGMYTVIMTCSGVFTISMVDGINANVLMNLAETLGIIYIGFFFYCYFSHEINYQCDKIRTSAYMCDWIDGSLAQKKCLLILMTRPMKVTKFGHLMDIELNTFINVNKTAFSYYYFLLTVTGFVDK